ncbi:hypothetical protein Tco_0097153 [Tanacetum coccineum]
MSSLYLIVNRVGSMVHLVKPLDIRKFKSSSYQALGACFNPYRSFLIRSSYIASVHAESAIASLMFVGSAVLTRVIFGPPVFEIVWLIEGGMSCVTLSVGEEDLLTPEVPTVKNSSYKGSNSKSKSCCDGAVVFAEGETFCSYGVRPELS